MARTKSKKPKLNWPPTALQILNYLRRWYPEFLREEQVDTLYVKDGMAHILGPDWKGGDLGYALKYGDSNRGVGARSVVHVYECHHREGRDHPTYKSLGEYDSVTEWLDRVASKSGDASEADFECGHPSRCWLEPKPVPRSAWPSQYRWSEQKRRKTG